MKIISRKINTEFIRLDSFLKLTGTASTGGQAKTWIQDGCVFVNNECCLQRGHKLRNGDIVQIQGEKTAFQVIGE